MARPAVPLFFMCSGALLLNRDIELGRFFRRNFLRIVAALLFWAFAYKLYGLYKSGFSAAGLVQAVKELFILKHEFHFYFLHILLLVYAFLPAVRVFVRQASWLELGYALLLWAVFGILFPLLQNFWPFTLVYTMNAYWYVMNICYSAIGYCLLGYGLRRYYGSIPRWVFALSLALGAAITLGGTAAGSLRAGQLTERYFEGMSPGPMLMATGIMGLMLGVRSWPERLRRAANSLARASFCVYLTHVFVLYELAEHGLNSASRSFLMIPLMAVIMLAVCWLLYQLLSRVPIVRDWLV